MAKGWRPSFLSVAKIKTRIRRFKCIRPCHLLPDVSRRSTTVLAHPVFLISTSLRRRWLGLTRTDPLISTCPTRIYLKSWRLKLDREGCRSTGPRSSSNANQACYTSHETRRDYFLFLFHFSFLWDGLVTIVGYYMVIWVCRCTSEELHDSCRNVC